MLGISRGETDAEIGRRLGRHRGRSAGRSKPVGVANVIGPFGDKRQTGLGFEDVTSDSG